MDEVKEKPDYGILWFKKDGAWFCPQTKEKSRRVKQQLRQAQKAGLVETLKEISK
jgi:uncharacterized Zn finger protein (UPF0148 family)